jgi:hypothetical protein
MLSGAVAPGKGWPDRAVMAAVASGSCDIRQNPMPREAP